MAKSNKPDPAKTIEIRLPKALYEKVIAIQAKDPDFINETIRAVFERDELFGINAIKISESKLTQIEIAKAKSKEREKDSKGAFFKLCDGP